MATCSVLTYMPTLERLVDDGLLIPIEVDLDEDEQAWRVIFGTREYMAWRAEKLPRLRVSGHSCASAEEQLFVAEATFVSGQRIRHGDLFKDLYPHENGVWEIRTPDIRVFGWFIRRDVFIAVCGGDSTIIHRYKEHDRHRDFVLRVRRALMGPDEHYLTGSIDDVVTQDPSRPKT
jgi:hypothetical protein